MPIYEYVCPTCSHKFDKLQSLGTGVAECPHCEQPAKKAISLFSAVTVGGDGEPVPMPSMGGGSCCGGGCGCGI